MWILCPRSLEQFPVSTVFPFPHVVGDPPTGTVHTYVTIEFVVHER